MMQKRSYNSFNRKIAVLCIAFMGVSIDMKINKQCLQSSEFVASHGVKNTVCVFFHSSLKFL